MDQLSADNVANLTKKVTAYGSQLAAVFHSYALSAEKIPRGFEGAINILDATVATLNRVLSLLKSEAESFKAGSGKNLFSEEGLEYVKLLATECAMTLAKVEPIVADACLSAKELKAKRRRDRRELAKNGPLNVDIGALELDEETFLVMVESTRWSMAAAEIEECMERLYDLQLHLLLVFQVVTVGAMSRDVSSGNVDVKGIVVSHERINRTAELVGIKPPKGRSRNKLYDSSTETDSVFDSNDSDSDDSRIVSRRRSGKAQAKESFASGPPPPPPVPSGPRLQTHAACPPPPPPANWPGGPPPSERVWNVPTSTASTTPPATTLAGTTVNSENAPPSYSESKPVADSTSSTTSTLLGTVSHASNAPTSGVISPEKSSVIEAAVSSDEKELPQDAPIEKSETASAPLGPRLFKSNTNGLRFKVKRLFRSNQSLADEMKEALSDSDSRLLAVVIQGGNFQQVPHSAFHSLEATHMRTILSQLNGDEWYDTFIKMDPIEHSSLGRLIHTCFQGKMYERELVVLKVIHEKKVAAWAALLRDIISKHPAPYNNSRVVLAILREKLVNGKALPLFAGAPPPPRGFPGLPLPPPPQVVPLVPLNPLSPVKPPPGLLGPPGRSTKTSDLHYPPPPRGIPTGPASASELPAAPGPEGGSRPGAISGGPITSVRVSDTTPLTEYDAMQSLTAYSEYSLHLAEPVNPGAPRSWARVVVTQESAERHLIVQRVQNFLMAGGNVLEAKLRLSDQQGSQVTRLMDELKGNERDSRFEWCWVEISLYNSFGEITDFASNGSFPKVASATMMHLIAKRMPKMHCKPLELYNSLMRPQPPQPPVNTAPVLIDLSREREVEIIRCGKDKYHSDSDSDRSAGTSLWSDNSSVGNVRRRLRKNKVRKAVEATWALDSGSDSDDSGDEDVIKITLELKRGDDVVQSLLDIWTPVVARKGKGKEKEKARKTAFGIVG